MPIEVDCPHCGRLLRAPDSAAGRRARCPECGGTVPLPGGVREAEEIREFDDFEAAFGPTSPQPGRGPAPASSRMPCPVCGEMIQRRAVHCRFCGENLGGSRFGSSYYPPAPSQGLAIASMVMGICGLSLFCLWPVSVPLAVLAVIFAAIDMGAARRSHIPVNGMAVAGLVCGILPLALWLVFLFFGLGGLRSH